MPLVTIFVQVYNTRNYVADCLKSVCGLRGDYDLEILVIDDASPDKSADVIKTFDDPRIKFIHHEKNAGSNATANEGYRLAQGKYVARLDSDDRYHADFLVHTVPLLEQYNDVGFAFADVALMDAAGVVYNTGGNVVRQSSPEPRNELFEILTQNYVPAPTTLMRKSALEPLLPIPSRYHFLDWYLTTGVSESWKCAYVDRVLADYRIHPTNMHKAMILDRSGEEITFSVLDRIFSNPLRAQEKARRKGPIYSINYAVQADKYFGYRMYRDARRCYWGAIRHQPSCMFHNGILRRLVGTYLPADLYDSAKSVLLRRSGAT
jgi:glycosyltransferase involved in cell wall biosynthesis